MEVIDWAIVLAMVVFLVFVGARCLKYTKGVADYLVANRCAGRYVLGMSEGAAGIGAISFMAAFEMYYKAGFSIAWWGLMMVVVQIIAALSGWVTYRFRQTRAMTLAQFLETRYSKRFRIFAGMLAFTAGIVNFGIFPAIGSRFFIYFCGFPDQFEIYGMSFSTFPVVMAGLILLGLFFTYIGMIAIMVTDFFQGIVINIGLLLLFCFVFWTFSWAQISEALSTAPPNASMIHPFHTSEARDFNVWYYLIAAFGTFYTLYCWQGSSGFQTAAISAHENKMSKIIQTTKTQIQNLQVMIIPIAAFTLMNSPEFASESTVVKGILSGIEDDTLRSQMIVPIVLEVILPAGIKGIVCAMMLGAFISNFNTYLLSWGGILIQDVILPLKKVRLTPQQHLNYLRVSVFGVAVFIFCFSLLFRQTQHIYMFFAVTGAIWLGGAGSVVIGGLYWKRGTTAAAYAALIVGSTLAVSGIVLEKIWPYWTGGEEFPINGQWAWLISMVCSIVVYVTVSLLGKPTWFDLDRLLHRGKFAVELDAKSTSPKTKGLKALLGISNEFTPRDVFTYLFSLCCTAVLALMFCVGTFVNMFWDVSTDAWMTFWFVFTLTTFVLGTLMSVWIAVGGLWELPRLFQRLALKADNAEDDGRAE